MTYVGDGETDAVIARSAHSQSLGVGPMTGTVLATAELTGGRYSLYRVRLGEDGGGAGAHFHRTFAESFHVLRGTVEFFDGHEWTLGGVDDHVFVPEGSIHGFRNVSGEVAELLMICTPSAPREDYFRELVEIVESGTQMTPEAFTKFWARHDQYMV